jgi:hypothetical protein
VIWGIAGTDSGEWGAAAYHTAPEPALIDS